MDSNSELHLFALQLIYLPRINAFLEQFIEQWNFYGISTAGYQSPGWHHGMPAFMKSRTVQNLRKLNWPHVQQFCYQGQDRFQSSSTKSIHVQPIFSQVQDI